MDFRDSARLDTSQVSDGRGRRGGGGRGMAIGGGGLGVVGLLIALLLGVNPADLGGGSDSLGSGSSTGSSGTSDLDERCRTGADADRDEDCRVVGIVNSVQAYWAGTVEGYQPAETELFSGSTTTACGAATSAVGPFYCPPDMGVYLDLSFFEVLRSQYGASGGDFAQAYVIAHEYGHHVQNLTGQSERSRQLPDQTGPQGASTRLELQADCYAGVWAHTVYKEGALEEGDISEALGAAGAVGDDRLQQRGGGGVNPESFTHGTSQQRERWFSKGYEGGEPGACDTFAVDEV